MPTKHENRLKFRKQLADQKEHRAQLASDKEKRSLADRIAPPPLLERIALEPIVQKLPLIDFQKHSDEELVLVYLPKIRAVIKRFVALEELAPEFPDVNAEHLRVFRHFAEKLVDLRDHIVERMPTVSIAQWKSLHFGLREIGNLSFGQIRCRYSIVLSNVAGVVQGGYFDWL